MAGETRSSLREVEWLLRYETGLQDLVNDFYVPALSRAMQYDREAGFFSSTALAVAAKGVARLVARGGRMRLLVGARLSAADVEAINEGYRRREEVIAEALTSAWEPTAEAIARDRLGALAEMVARGSLEIRVVVALGADGRVLRAEQAEGLFHEKCGVFTDAAGDRVAFVGSINETAAAWEDNIEQLLVFRSWDVGESYVATIGQDFERIWADEHPRARTLELPEAVRERLLELRPEAPPEYDPQEKAAVAAQEIAEERERWLFQFLRDAPLLENGNAVVDGGMAVRPWPHQLQVCERACRDYPERWHMLCDEVGLGKTIEAGLILRRLLLTQRVRRVLILAPKHLVRQWQEELREKFNLWAYWYDGKSFVDPVGGVHEAPENPWDAEYSIIVASAHLAKRRGRMEVLLAAREWDLVLVDEAHHARRGWGPGSDNRPNRMLQLLDALRARTRGMLLLTATPMQIDVRELWDLLRIVGMDGRWAEGQGEAFRQYFHTLGHEQWEHEDLAFLLEMVCDYFAAGGEPDSSLAERMKAEGEFVLWSQLTRATAPADAARVAEALRRSGLGSLVRRFLCTHTPVRQFVSRYTRETLRRYRAQGLFDANIATRCVEDRFIDLGPARPLYDKIEEYISQHYRKAQAEGRRGLGYVMTIYRQRLTSSPRAIIETLRRHRDTLVGGLRGETRRVFAEYLTEEDLGEADLLEDAFEKLASDEGLDPEALAAEIVYLAKFLWELGALGTDPKLQGLLRDLEGSREQHPRAVIFTQYTDTMDFVREALVSVYGSQVACYSGRGGEKWDSASCEWVRTTKDDIKEGFFEDSYRLLVCTEAASEGINLQASDLLINYDMPWNPMRVEQRIGRIDRIGQHSERVYVINYYYAGSVEAAIYEVLRERMGIFTVAVGPLQPVLGRVAKHIERMAMSSLAERAAVIDEEKRRMDEEIADAKTEGINVDELTSVELAGQEAQQAPVRAEEVRDVMFGSGALASHWGVREAEPGVWEVELAGAGPPVSGPRRVTFHQSILEQRPDSVQHCLAWGDPLFDQLLDLIPAPRTGRWGPLERRSEPEGQQVQYIWHGADGQDPIRDLRELSEGLARIHRPPD